jgi:hypothetical protein
LIDRCFLGNTINQFKENARERLEKAVENGVGFHALERVVGFQLSLGDRVIDYNFGEIA